MIGHIIGSYKILERIGEGGMGTVYKGVDQMLEREVAVKVLRADLAHRPMIAERFRSEAVTLARATRRSRATSATAASTWRGTHTSSVSPKIIRSSMRWSNRDSSAKSKPGPTRIAT